MMTLSSERATAYAVLSLIVVLALAAVLPGARSAPTPAQAAAPILIVATPTPNPAWTPRPELPAREARPVLAAPTEAPAAVVDSAPAGVAEAPATIAEPPARLIQESDGSLTLPGVDTSWPAPPEPTAMPEPPAAPVARGGGCAARGPAAERFCKR